jgi:hypothetical protein
MTGKSRRTLEEKLIEKTQVDPKTKCWVWTAAKSFRSSYTSGAYAKRQIGYRCMASRKNPLS